MQRRQASEVNKYLSNIPGDPGTFDKACKDYQRKYETPKKKNNLKKSKTKK